MRILGIDPAKDASEAVLLDTAVPAVGANGRVLGMIACARYFRVKRASRPPRVALEWDLKPDGIAVLPDAVALEMPEHKRGVYFGHSGADLLAMLPAACEIRAWFHRYGVPVYEVGPHLARTCSAWRTNLKVPFDKYRKQELESLGLDCGRAGLSTPGLRDAYTVAQFVAQRRPELLSELLYRPAWPLS